MALFCHACGTRNEEGAAFCENCGTPLRKREAPASDTAATPATPSSAAPGAPSGQAGPAAFQQPTSTPWKPSRGLVMGLVGAGVVVLALAGGAVWWMQPPAASTAALGAAFKASAPGVDTGERIVCISNGLPYDQRDINVGAMDQGTRQWMEMLVEAGLYTYAGDVSSGGYFPQILRQYKPTAELSKWSRNRRLCVASGLEASSVGDIGEPSVEKPRGQEVRVVRATGLWTLKEGAPWLAKPKVLETIRGELPRASGGEWAVDGDRLVFKKPMTFAVVDRQWKTVNPAEGYAGLGLSMDQDGPKRPQADRPGPSGGGFWDKLSGLFSFGGHPLQGRWQVDLEAMGLGGVLPPEMGGRSVMVFTGNSLEVEGRRMAARFEVEGSQVKVIPEDSSGELVFTIRPDGRAVLEMGFLQMVYKRAE